MKKNYLKSMIKMTIITVWIISTFSLLSCGNSSSRMTSLDKKYDKLARQAAEKLLQSEASDYTWTTVDTGDVVYLYTAKNAEGDQFQVHYLAKFDVADEPEDEWVELTISLSGKSGSVTNVSVSYWNVDTYEACFDEKGYYLGFDWSSDGWYNVNLTDEDFEVAKKRNGR